MPLHNFADVAAWPGTPAKTIAAGLMALGVVFAMATPLHAADAPAKTLFGGVKKSAALKPASYGSYAKGCLAGGEKLKPNDRAWQAMRLSRNRTWGHPALIAYLAKLAHDARDKDGWRGLLVGDMAQPRGGPMLTGHASHQIGLDADIWLKPMPDHVMSDKEREDVSAVSVIKSRSEINPEVWSKDHFKLIKRAASYDEVARIFVHPAIKKTLCAEAGKDRGWLRKIRPWYGHHYHFHVRLACPDTSGGCKDQAPPPPGEGCGKSLSWWLSDKPYAKAKPDPKKKPKKRRELTLKDLPKACAGILDAGARSPGETSKTGDAGNGAGNSAGNSAAKGKMTAPVPRRKPPRPGAG